MPRSMLGKRARGSKETANAEVDVPSKRTRLQTRSFYDDEENMDPNADRDAPEKAKSNFVIEITEEVLPSSDESDYIPNPRAKSVDVKKVEFKPITPSTPRFWDALARAPVTPRHRVMSLGRITKRQTPQTPATPTNLQTVYHHARQVFARSADPGQLIGRDDERQELQKFLEACSGSSPNGCLYVSGPPGTGKSAMVNRMTKGVEESVPQVKKAYINCMSIKSSKDLYATLLDLIYDESDVAEDDVPSTLQKMFMSRKKSARNYLVVLDEIDHILSLDLESLYRLFEWSMQKTSHLVLVGIANALDLTDRFLPRLKSRNLKPTLLPFLPYSASQIKTIITGRLRTLVPEGAPLPFFHPAAIELCSRKIASQTGDLRKAFEVCRRAIDLVEMETKQKYEAEIKEQNVFGTPSRKILAENKNLSSPARGDPERNSSETLIKALQRLTLANAPKVTIAHLNKITAAAFSNGTSQRLKTLNLQQKAALCSLVALEQRNRTAKASILFTPSKAQSAAPTIKTLYDTYCRLCKQDAILHPLSSSEFREVMGSLETLSLVTTVNGKTGSLAISTTPSKRTKRTLFGPSAGLVDEKRVASCVGEKEMEAAIEGLGAGILRSILDGEALV